MAHRKIINDPVYGFITIDNALVFEVVSHPFYQRLRRIHQMALAHLVYPGAVHSRLHHSLGSYHLMGNALNELKGKGFLITPEEEVASRIAILLHDIGHGPFSHALEHTLVKSLNHEDISLLLMKEMNVEMGNSLDMAISIFTDQYDKKFLHQLVSGQLDVDRMDYLTRDSFFTGVSEGVIGYDRIIKMLTVHNGELMIEEKGIYSIEKFLVARRLMYWQVYLHKTVLSAEKMLIRIIGRAREIKATSPSEVLNFFLHEGSMIHADKNFIDRFCRMDDYDVLAAIKSWTTHPDKVLSFLCKGIVNRALLKVKFFSRPVSDAVIQQKKKTVGLNMGLNEEELSYLVFQGETENRTYNSEDEHIHILFKDGTVKDISEVDNALINQTLYGTVKKFYLCYPN